MITSKTLYAGEGRHRVCLVITFTEDGLVAQLYGGEKPHVGAVVLTLPRPSLRDRNRLSCNSSVLPRVGHKEDELAKPLAEKIAICFRQPVVLVAGLHIDNASREDIEKLIENCWLVLEQLLQNHRAGLNY